jgi:predicted ATPase
MPRWLQRFFARRPPAPEPLKGRRATPRIKSYSALSGYVYEYTYQGYRDRDDLRTHVFDVSPDRQQWFAFEVSIPGAALTAWEHTNARTLNEAERYAVAKLALFAAFDDRPNPRALQAASVIVDAAQVAQLLDSIDL